MNDNDENMLFFPGETKEGFSPEMILRGALKAGLADVVVLGWYKDDALFMSSSLQDSPDIVWLLEKAKMTLVGYNIDEYSG